MEEKEKRVRIRGNSICIHNYFEKHPIQMPRIWQIFEFRQSWEEVAKKRKLAIFSETARRRSLPWNEKDGQEGRRRMGEKNTGENGGKWVKNGEKTYKSRGRRWSVDIGRKRRVSIGNGRERSGRRCIRTCNICARSDILKCRPTT